MPALGALANQPLMNARLIGPNITVKKADVPRGLSCRSGPCPRPS